MEGIMIKEAAKMLGVEAHVLRYWEDELGLTIKRNTMGHRYYDERDIKMFTEVQALKAKGLTLKDIRTGIEKHKQGRKNSEMQETLQQEVIHNGGNGKEEYDSEKQRGINGQEENNTRQEIKTPEKVSGEDIKVVDFKLAQMQSVMNRVIANALRENKGIIASSIKGEITEDVMKQLDVIMREREEREEERFRKLDECLRRIQLANEEVAATRMRRRFRRKKP